MTYVGCIQKKKKTEKQVSLSQATLGRFFGNPCFTNYQIMVTVQYRMSILPSYS